MLLVAQNNVFKGIPIPTGAKAITEGNTIQSSSSSQPNSNSPPAGCINYNPSTKTITVSCSSARLTDIDNTLHDSNILSKQYPADGVWYLNSNLVIAKGATFHIDSTDTKWLKISSKVTHSAACYEVSSRILD